MSNPLERALSPFEEQVAEASQHLDEPAAIPNPNVIPSPLPTAAPVNYSALPIGATTTDIRIGAASALSTSNASLPPTSAAIPSSIHSLIPARGDAGGVDMAPQVPAPAVVAAAALSYDGGINLCNLDGTEAVAARASAVDRYNVRQQDRIAGEAAKPS